MVLFFLETIPLGPQPLAPFDLDWPLLGPRHPSSLGFPCSTFLWKRKRPSSSRISCLLCFTLLLWWRSSSRSLSWKHTWGKILKPFFKNWSILAWRCRVSFCNTAQGISYMSAYTPSLLSSPPTLTHPTRLGHHRAWSWAPCALWQLPTSYLFYIW